MKYIFIGNRVNVLKKMIELECDIVEIFAIENSYLHKQLIMLNLPFKIILDKKNLINDIMDINFDCLVSNGCPYILPVSNMKKQNQLYINIHPSLLPDLKGKHPINGALLFNRKHGVTCHHMDDGIDTGDIICNVKIPIDSQIDLALLYQLSFIAEGEVFSKAFSNNFQSKLKDIIPEDSIYYTRKDEDQLISSKDSFTEILNKIRAFGIPSLCAKFYRKDEEFRILSAKVIHNTEIRMLFKNIKSDRIVCIYNNKTIVKYDQCIIVFKLLNTHHLQVGERFFNFKIIK